MSPLLDLSITLTPPPAGSPPEAIASVLLRYEALGMAHSGDLLSNPVTTQERDSLRWYLEEYWQWPYYEFAERSARDRGPTAGIGKRLYQMVFGSPEAVSILQAWRLQPGGQRQISIISKIAPVLSLPWELLHDEQGFLALRTRQPISIVRRLPQGELAAFPTPFEPPLRILLVTARPEDAGFIDPRGVARELLDEVHEQITMGTIALEFLRPPTLTALRNRLKDTTKPVHILHFDGHGVFANQMASQDGLSQSGGAQGMLAFEDTRWQA